MAKIEGTTWKDKRRLSIRLLPPAKTGDDATEYEIELWTDTADTARVYKFSVEEWTEEHLELWLIARTFASASALVGAKLPMELWGHPKKERAHAYQHCDSLRVVLSSLYRLKRNWACVEFYIQEGSTSDVYRRFFLRCSLNDAEQFGKDLEQEIFAAAPRWHSENRYGEDGQLANE